MARIEDNNLTAGGYSFLSQKEDILKGSKSDKTKKANKTSLFDKLLGENEASEQSQSSTFVAWGDDYQQNVHEELKEIGLLGERIKKSHNYNDVQEYKSRVKNFLQNAIEKSEKLEARVTGSVFRNTLKSKAVINIIDKELNELTKEFFAIQISTIRVASSIDKIQGLLVDLAS